MKKIIFCLTAVIFSVSAFSQKAQLVNPFVGTDEHGHTYPGVTAPFGQVQLSPDTRLNGWDGCSGYHYSDNKIYGFSHTHLSGTGCEDLCDILFTPTVHSKDWQDLRLDFKHSDEQAYAGYYKVKGFNKAWITTELAATQRHGYHLYTFPKNDTMALVIDLKHRDYTIDWNVEIKDKRTVVGYRNSKSWNENQHTYFASSFNKDIIDSYLDKKTGKLYLYFGQTNKVGTQLEAKVSISSVDKEGALKNLNSQSASTFAQAKKQSVQLWEKALSVIDVQGGSTQQQRTFYTSLYHCMIAPNLYSDIDGRYRAMINNNKDFGKTIEDGRPLNPIATAVGYDRYSVFSLWDTYRALNPLLSLIKPELCQDFEKTFLDYYRQTNELPMWELHSWETYCMIGIHGVSVLAEWIRKGIVVDNDLALEAMIATANMQKIGLPYFNRDGYISAEFEHEGVAKTVEFCYNMYCIAQTAKMLGKDDIYAEYIQKAQYYKNLFNPQNTFIQPKENGRFLPNFDPKQVDINYTEGNGWHYTFYVPQDINTLAMMMGGDKAFENKLDECFNSIESTTGRNQADVTGLIGQYAHGNEPSHHTAYLYNYVGKAYKTQKLVRQILNTLYSDKPDGVCGNDDCGQMAAWYVLSAMGLYAVAPVSGEYIIGSPLFDKVTINLQNGKKFVINSKQGKNTPYVKSLKLNNKNYTKSYLTHEDLINGGTLTFEMSDKPNYDFASKKEDCPKAQITDNLISVVPYLEYDGTGTFSGKEELKVNYLDNNFKVYKTEKLILDNTQQVNVSNIYNNKVSKNVHAMFYKIPEGRSIRILTKYSPQYTAGGDNALIDQKMGTDNWRLGCWQGYWGEDVEAVIDLGENKKVNNVGGHFVQDERAWIFMPVKVEYYVSDNGKDFTLFETVQNPIDERKSGVITYTFRTTKPINSRYIKMKAINRKTNPDWHLSPGEKSWLFIDEVIVM
ncbi:MAG: GH92 family glycosyl hydrolase [Bacteroidales bacterium]|nr:GH92 family glycosyl hydrolase [Bacteroidales bacterium]